MGAEALQSTDTSTVLDEESLDLWGEEVALFLSLVRLRR